MATNNSTTNRIGTQSTLMFTSPKNPEQHDNNTNNTARSSITIGGGGSSGLGYSFNNSGADGRNSNSAATIEDSTASGTLATTNSTAERSAHQMMLAGVHNFGAVGGAGQHYSIGSTAATVAGQQIFLHSNTGTHGGSHAPVVQMHSEQLRYLSNNNNDDTNNTSGTMTNGDVNANNINLMGGGHFHAYGGMTFMGAPTAAQQYQPLPNESAAYASLLPQQPQFVPQQTFAAGGGQHNNNNNNNTNSNANNSSPWAQHGGAPPSSSNSAGPVTATSANSSLPPQYGQSNNTPTMMVAFNPTTASAPSPSVSSTTPSPTGTAHMSIPHHMVWEGGFGQLSLPNPQQALCSGGGFPLGGDGLLSSLPTTNPKFNNIGQNNSSNPPIYGGPLANIGPSFFLQSLQRQQQQQQQQHIYQQHQQQHPGSRSSMGSGSSTEKSSAHGLASAASSGALSSSYATPPHLVGLGLGGGTVSSLGSAIPISFSTAVGGGGTALSYATQHNNMSAPPPTTQRGVPMPMQQTLPQIYSAQLNNNNTNTKVTVAATGGGGVLPYPSATPRSAAYSASANSNSVAVGKGSSAIESGASRGGGGDENEENERSNSQHSADIGVIGGDSAAAAPVGVTLSSIVGSPVVEGGGSKAAANTISALGLLPPALAHSSSPSATAAGATAPSDSIDGETNHFNRNNCSNNGLQHHIAEEHNQKQQTAEEEVIDEATKAERERLVSAGWIPLPRQLCRNFLLGRLICNRIPCKYFHGDERALAIAKAKGHNAYRPTDAKTEQIRGDLLVYLATNEASTRQSTLNGGAQSTHDGSRQCRPDPSLPQLHWPAATVPPSASLSSPDLDSTSVSTPAETTAMDNEKAKQGEEKGAQSSLPSPTSASAPPSASRAQSICATYYAGKACIHGVACPFLHSPAEYRMMDREVCAYHRAGSCGKGSQCAYFHGTDEERQRLIDQGARVYNAVTKEAVPPSALAADVRDSAVWWTLDRKEELSKRKHDAENGIVSSSVVLATARMLKNQQANAAAAIASHHASAAVNAASIMTHTMGNNNNNNNNNNTMVPYYHQHQQHAFASVSAAGGASLSSPPQYALPMTFHGTIPANMHTNNNNNNNNNNSASRTNTAPNLLVGLGMSNTYFDPSSSSAGNSAMMGVAPHHPMHLHMTSIAAGGGNGVLQGTNMSTSSIHNQSNNNNNNNNNNYNYNSSSIRNNITNASNSNISPPHHNGGAPFPPPASPMQFTQQQPFMTVFPQQQQQGMHSFDHPNATLSGPVHYQQHSPQHQQMMTMTQGQGQVMNELSQAQQFPHLAHSSSGLSAHINCPNTAVSTTNNNNNKNNLGFGMLPQQQHQHLHFLQQSQSNNNNNNNNNNSNNNQHPPRGVGMGGGHFLTQQPPQHSATMRSGGPTNNAQSDHHTFSSGRDGSSARVMMELNHPSQQQPQKPLVNNSYHQPPQQQQHQQHYFGGQGHVYPQ